MNPFLRFVGRNRVDESQPWIREWAPRIVDWLKAGLAPFVFNHTPDDFLAPHLCRAMQVEILRLEPELPAIKPWPAEIERQRDLKQKRLF